MSWFKKEEHVSFERNHEGRVIGGYRDGKMFKVDQNRKPEPQYKSSRQLEQEYYAKHPKPKPRTPRPGHSFFNPLNRIDVVPVPYRKPVKLSPQIKPYKISKSNRNPFSNVFDTGMPNAPRIKKPVSSSKKKKSKRKDPLLGFDMLGNNWRL